MRNHALSGVIYAEDFDMPVAAVAPPLPVEPIVVEPTFSLTELRQATERAEQDGRELERHAVELGVSAIRADALVRVSDALNAGQSDRARVMADAATATAGVLLGMVAAVLPAFAASRGHDEARALLGLLLPTMSHEPRLTIRAHPTLLEGLREDMTTILEDSPVMVDWIGSNSMQPGDISIRWQDGMLMRDTQALCTQVQELIMPALAPMDAPQETYDGK
ncbi:hypothetical protein [Lichenicola sp.]|uniref:hypothetical protein n=1 Tax=Lichenicola sp. TaxID=2804529 RepID=UPI003AFFDCFF